MTRFFKLILMTAVMAAFLGLPAYAQAALSVSPGLVAEGQTALAEGDLQKALSYFEQAMVADPTNPDAYVGVGQTYEAAGSAGLSLKYYTLAADLAPTSLNILELQGLAFIATESLDDAKANLEKMKTLCRQGTCPEVERLESALAPPDESPSE